MGQRDKYLAQIRQIQNADPCGVCLQHTADPDGGFPFTYTIGLGGRDHPEFIIFGLPPQDAGRVLNNLARRVVHEGVRFAHGDTVHNLLVGYPTRLIEVTDSSVHLILANLFYRVPGREPIPALQVAWPDADNRFPWQPGSRVTHPILGPVPADDAGQIHTLTRANPSR